MRAVRVVGQGEPTEVVRVDDVPVPEPAAGQLLVRVGAASLNFGDIARCRGTLTTVPMDPPFGLGMDMCGTAVAAGAGAEDWVGRRVVGLTPLALEGQAEYAVAGTWFDAPDGLDDVEAAGFIIPFHLAALALRERAALRPGETLLVRGGASGVGSAAIQVGAALGATVVATAGGPEKVGLCREAGASHVFDHHDTGLFEGVMDATSGRGADVIFDPIGGEDTETAWTCGVVGGRYVAAGFNDDPSAGMTGRPLRRLAMANMTAIGVVLAYAEPDRGLRQFGLNPFPPLVGTRVHAWLLDGLRDGSLTSIVRRVVEMEDVGPALADHAARRTAGRTVLRVASAVGGSDAVRVAD